MVTAARFCGELWKQDVCTDITVNYHTFEVMNFESIYDGRLRISPGVNLQIRFNLRQFGTLSSVFFYLVGLKGYLVPDAPDFRVISSFEQLIRWIPCSPSCSLYLHFIIPFLHSLFISLLLILFVSYDHLSSFTWSYNVFCFTSAFSLLLILFSHFLFQVS